LVVGEDRLLARPLREVLAAIDLSAASKPVLESAASFLDGCCGRLWVMTAIEKTRAPERWTLPTPYPEPDPHKEKVEARLRELLVRVSVPSAVTTHVEVRPGAPAAAIFELAHEAGIELIVVGTSGHSALHRAVLGSTATRVLSEASCPVLVVPHGPFKAE
jgi:nucleotide-binding universal stress UspA family protein